MKTNYLPKLTDEQLKLLDRLRAIGSTEASLILMQGFFIQCGLWQQEENILTGIPIDLIEISWLQYIHLCINLAYGFDLWLNSPRTPIVDMVKLKLQPSNLE